MAEVFLDGEKVDFQGEAPRSAAQAWELVEQFVGSQGRVLDSVSVDGTEYASAETLVADGYSRMEFQTMSAVAKLLRMGRSWREACQGHVAKLEAAASVVLRKPWRECEASTVELVEGLREYIEGFGIIESFGREQELPWATAFSEAFAEGISSIDGLISGIQGSDCVLVSDEIALSIVPCWKSIIAELDAKVLPQLEKEGVR